MFRLAIAFAAAASIAGPALAAPVKLANAVFVERHDESERARVLEPARTLRRGDKLVYVVSWQTNAARPERFTITNPLPRTVSYQRSASTAEEVSVDGGKRWGKLEALRIGERIATPEDVTHVRWHVPPVVAARGSGRITYSAIVR